MIELILSATIAMANIEYGIKGCGDEQITQHENAKIEIKFLNGTPEIFEPSSFPYMFFESPYCRVINAKVVFSFNLDKNGVVENFEFIDANPKGIMEKHIKNAIHKLNFYPSAFGRKNNKIEIIHLGFSKKT